MLASSNEIPNSLPWCSGNLRREAFEMVHTFHTAMGACTQACRRFRGATTEMERLFSLLILEASFKHLMRAMADHVNHKLPVFESLEVKLNSQK